VINIVSLFRPKQSNKQPEWFLCHKKKGLYHHQQFHRIDEKQYQMLVLFSKSNGEVITKDTILDTIWQGKIVTEDAVYVLINGLRKLLNDKAKDPKFILTVSGKGYRWVYEDLEYQKASNPNYSFLFIGVFVLLILTVSVWQLSHRKESNLTEIQREQFSKARYILNNQSENSEHAVTILRQLLLQTPSYEPAHEALIDALFNKATNQGFSDKVLVDELKKRLDAALKVNPDNLIFNYFQARIAFLVDWHFDKANKHFQKALPNVQAHNHYGQFLLAMRDFEGALYHTKQYQYLDADGYSSESAAWVYMMSANRKQAIIELEKLKPYSDDSFYYHVCLQALYEQVGEEHKSFSELIWLMRAVGYDQNDIDEITDFFQQNGLKGAYSWLLLVDKKQLNIGQYEAPMSLARYAAYIGEHTLAVSYLNAAKKQKQLATLWVAADPKFKPLYQNSAFQEFLASINLSL